MADKFFIFGTTYNGDGTASNEAASNGAAGAWNNAAYLTGTAPTSPNGSLAAGDVVYIRSKTGAGADANISNTLAASITLGAGSAVATLAAPITWILDNGTVWSGVNGTLTYTTSNAAYNITLRPYNRFVSQTKHNWILENTATAPSVMYVFWGCSTWGLNVNYPNRDVGITGYGGITFDGGIHEHLKVYTKKLSSNASTTFLGTNSSPAYSTTIVLNDFELESTDAPAASTRVFGFGNYFGEWRLSGGALTGTGPTAGHVLCSPPSSYNNTYMFHAVGFQIPKTVSFCPAATARTGSAQIDAYGLDGGPGGEIWANWGNADSRNYSYAYPALNATLPDSVGSAVSWRLVPEFATWVVPAVLDISKLYTSAAATKTVTMELLVSNNWGAGVINKNTVWMEVSYIRNDTGAAFSETTRLPVPGTDLDASTALWSATSWGSVSFTGDSTNSRGKRKLSLTTTYAIKQDTSVSVRFVDTAKVTNAAYDIFIIDPDVQLS